MPEWLWGFLGFPAAVLALALLAGIVFGAWLLTEKWFDNRFVAKNPKWQSDPEFGRWTVPEGRDNAAATIALAPKLTRIKLGFGTSLWITRGSQHIGWRPGNSLASLIWQAVNEHERLGNEASTTTSPKE